MSPTTPDNGGDATPEMGHAIVTHVTCPECGYEFPPIAHPAGPQPRPSLSERALIRRHPTPPPDDGTTPFPQELPPVDRYAETQILDGRE